MIRKILFCALVGALFIQSGFAVDKTELCDGTVFHPCLVKDNNDSHASFTELRTGLMIADHYPGNIAGVSHLTISASSQPSQGRWSSLKSITVKPIVVIDLRQENHGYLNGKPVTLVSEHDWINLNKTNEQIAQFEAEWLRSLASQSVVNGILTPKQFVIKDFGSGESLFVESVQSEEESVRSQGYEYHRLYVADHQPPKNSEVDSFLQLIHRYPEDTWFHFHCRAGRGRTTTFLVMFDMIKNADKVGFEEIILRNASIPPYYNLLKIHREHPELTIFYMYRLLFLQKFYQYARASLKGYSGTWSEYLNTTMTHRS